MFRCATYAALRRTVRCVLCCITLYCCRAAYTVVRLDSAGLRKQTVQSINSVRLRYRMHGPFM